MQFVLDALAAAREETGRLREALRGLLDCHEYLSEKAGANHDSCSRVQTAWAALAREDGG